MKRKASALGLEPTERKVKPKLDQPSLLRFNGRLMLPQAVELNCIGFLSFPDLLARFLPLSRAAKPLLPRLLQLLPVLRVTLPKDQPQNQERALLLAAEHCRRLRVLNVIPRRDWSEDYKQRVTTPCVR